MKSPFAFPIVLALSAVLAVANPSSNNGIEVVGSGTVELKPAIAELTFAVDATAEVAGDAITRFEQSRSRATEALNQLQIPNAEIIQQAFSIGVGNKNQNSRAHMGMHRGTRTTPTEVMLSQPVTIRISGVDKLDRKELIERLTRIIDTARDLGLKLTNSNSSSGTKSGAVRFLLNDPEKAQSEALDAAFADARKRADTLAKLAGVKLGSVLSLEANFPKESNQQPSSPRTVYNQWGGMYVQPQATNHSGAFTAIPVRASVRVRFAIAQ